MRFASHRDVARAFERGVRRAGLPIAHSAGFSPHPKISYAGGAPTGVASEAEYLSLALTSLRTPADVRELLDAALPDGIAVIDVTEDAGGLTGSRLEASEWLVVLPGVAPETAETAVAGFLALDQAPVERLTSKGVRRMDARAPVVALEVDRGAAEKYPYECEILRMVVRHMEPAVRPEDVLTSLREVFGVNPSSPPLVTRLAQVQLAQVQLAGGQVTAGQLSAGPLGAGPLGRTGAGLGTPVLADTVPVDTVPAADTVPAGTP
jgi:radical SAM-linked protein